MIAKEKTKKMLLSFQERWILKWLYSVSGLWGVLYKPKESEEGSPLVISMADAVLATSVQEIPNWLPTSLKNVDP